MLRRGHLYSYWPQVLPPTNFDLSNSLLAGQRAGGRSGPSTTMLCPLCICQWEVNPLGRKVGMAVSIAEDGPVIKAYHNRKWNVSLWRVVRVFSFGTK